MGKRNGIFVIPGVLLLAVFLSTNLFSAQIDAAIQSLKPSNLQSEISNPPSVKSNPSNPQSTIQNLSSTEIVDPKLDSAAFAQKTKKLQIPFLANNGQVDEQVKFYANTFGGTVFVTKDGEIVYSLPNNSSDVETQCLASSMHSPNGIHNAKYTKHVKYHKSFIVHLAS